MNAMFKTTVTALMVSGTLLFTLNAQDFGEPLMGPPPEDGGFMGPPPEDGGQMNSNSGSTATTNAKSSRRNRGDSADSGESSRRRPSFGGENGANPFSQVMDKLKQDYPEEFKEIEELRSTDRRAAMEKMRALMQKAGIEFPQMGGMRPPATPDSMPTENNVPPPSTKRNIFAEIKQAEQRIAAKFPAAYAKLQELRQENMPEARREFTRLYKLLPKPEAPDRPHMMMPPPDGMPGMKNMAAEQNAPKTPAIDIATTKPLPEDGK